MNILKRIKLYLRHPELVKYKLRRLPNWRYWDSYTKTYRSNKKALTDKFEQFCHLTDPSAIEKARELVSQQGAVDLAVEGLDTTENQRDLSIKFHWGHDHNFGDGFSVQGRMGDHHIRLIAEFMVGFNLPNDYFFGKDCIDVGSWTGGTTLMLKCLGARNVLALEEVKKYANTARSLCNDVYNLDGVTSNGVNLYELSVDDKYDIACFPGVIYHLSDPVVGLRRLYNALKLDGVCLIETAGIDSSKSIAQFDGTRVYFDRGNDESAEKLNRGGWNWYIPSALCLERWMIEAGFDEVRTYFSHMSRGVYGYGVKRKYNPITRAGLSVLDIK